MVRHFLCGQVKKLVFPHPVLFQEDLTQRRKEEYVADRF